MFGSPFPFLFPCELVEWFRDLAVVLDESSVEVTESKETLEFFQLLWCQPACQGLGFDRIHLNSPFRYYHPQVLNFFFFDLALLWFDVEFVCLEDLQNLLGDSSVLFKGSGVDYNIIDIDGDLSSVNEVLEDVVHYQLERCR